MTTTNIDAALDLVSKGAKRSAPKAAATSAPKNARIERLNAMKAEAAAKKLDPTVATPITDAYNRGEKAAKVTKASSNGNRAPRKVSGPEPVKAAAGELAIALRSEKHAELLKASFKRHAVAKVEGWTLLFKRSDAQAVVDIVSNASTTKAIYDARLYVATLVQIRHDAPSTTDTKKGVTTKLVDTLNAMVKAKTIADWSITIRLDGTLDWNVDDPTQQITTGDGVGAKSLWSVVASDAPVVTAPAVKATKATTKAAPAKATKATTTKTPAKKAPAKQTAKLVTPRPKASTRKAS